jgi:hypothetical protein
MVNADLVLSICEANYLNPGAPECDKQRLGTITPHLQTIDTWSFGCVLSAVATWVILGSQTYDSYRQVRMLEIANLRLRAKDGNGGGAPSGDDAFHDGTKVLPSVLHWHDFLRNSSRKADTISCRVLNLIEERMLLESPSKRLSFEQLCGELEDIILLAKNEHQKLTDRGSLKVIEPDTLEALLQLDKRAPATPTPIVQVNTTQNAGRSSGSLSPDDRSQLRPRSERVRKSERLERIVIGKTANREGAIKIGLGIVNEDLETCDSPQQDPADAGETISKAFASAKSCQDSPASSSKGKGEDIPVINLIYDSPVATHAGAFPPAIMGATSHPRKDSQQSFKPEDPPGSTTITNSSSSTEEMQQTAPPLQKNLSKGKGKEVLGRSGYFGQDEEIASIVNRGRNFRTPVTPPEIDKAPATQIATESTARPPQAYSQPPNVTPNKNLPPTPQTSPDPVLEYDLLVGLSPTSMQPPSYAIFDEQARLEKLWGDKKGLFTSLLSKIPDDPWLKNFISNRDIVGYPLNFLKERLTDLYHRFSSSTMLPL